MELTSTQILAVIGIILVVAWLFVMLRSFK